MTVRSRLRSGCALALPLALALWFGLAGVAALIVWLFAGGP